MKKILFVASESVPFIKTGGLADVMGALPKEFRKEAWDMRVVIPNYTCIDPKFREKFQFLCDFYMDLGVRGQKYVGVFTYEYAGITFYFIDNLEYFECFYPYGDMKWDIEKFIYFSKAALSMLPVVDFKPDLIHCHDWQSGLVPVYLKTQFQANAFYWGIKTIMTIHNLRFQGVWDIKTIADISGLPGDLFTPDKLEFNRSANLLKGGLVYADYITTVSPTYAGEIQMPYYGEGLDGLLSSRHFDLQGIINGIDYETFDPATDMSVYKQYDTSSFKAAKKYNKKHLQEELGLAVDDKKFVIGLISRLTNQKGLDLINYCAERLLDDFTQFVVIGTGDTKYENTFRHFAWKYPDRFSANIFYSDDLARKLYASADVLLVPSAYEPCGLTQMIAFRYGTVPIVRETGGLKDTVEPFNQYEKSGNGFSFCNYNGDELYQTINYAKYVYFEKKRWWNEIVKRGMEADYSWKKSMERYEGLYRYLIEDDQ